MPHDSPVPRTGRPDRSGHGLAGLSDGLTTRTRRRDRDDRPGPRTVRERALVRNLRCLVALRGFDVDGICEALAAPAGEGPTAGAIRRWLQRLLQIGAAGGPNLDTPRLMQLSRLLGVDDHRDLFRPDLIEWPQAARPADPAVTAFAALLAGGRHDYLRGLVARLHEAEREATGFHARGPHGPPPPPKG